MNLSTNSIIRLVRNLTRPIHYATVARRYRRVGDAPISTLVKPGHTIIQAGCVEIDTVNSWSRVVGPNGKVIVVEALSNLCEKLRGEIVRAELTNITVVNAAVWDTRAQVPLKTSSFAHRNRIEQRDVSDHCNPDDVYDDTVMVAAAPLDDILEGIGETSIDHVHLTVSGAENRAIEGMGRLLTQKGISIHARCMLFDSETGLPMSHKVADTLRKLGLRVTVGRPENGREGAGNVYAQRF